MSAAVAKERRPKSSSGVLKPFPLRFSNLVDLVPVNEVYPEVPCKNAGHRAGLDSGSQGFQAEGPKHSELRTL